MIITPIWLQPCAKLRASVPTLGHHSRHTLSLSCIKGNCAMKNLNWRCTLTGSAIEANAFRQKCLQRTVHSYFMHQQGTLKSILIKLFRSYFTSSAKNSEKKKKRHECVCRSYMFVLHFLIILSEKRYNWALSFARYTEVYKKTVWNKNTWDASWTWQLV